jgi:hypothetical protein
MEAATELAYSSSISGVLMNEIIPGLEAQKQRAERVGLESENRRLKEKLRAIARAWGEFKKEGPPISGQPGSARYRLDMEMRGLAEMVEQGEI